MEIKGLVKRSYVDGNKKEMMYCLTDMGKEVHQAHEGIHRDLYVQMDELLDRYDGAEIEKLHYFLRGVEKYMRCCVEGHRNY